MNHIQNNHAHSKVLLDQERFLPIGKRKKLGKLRELINLANIARIMKKMIPSNGKIAKEAKQCVQECVSEFISFVTSEAHDKCASVSPKSIIIDKSIKTLGKKITRHFSLLF